MSNRLVRINETTSLASRFGGATRNVYFPDAVSSGSGLQC